MKTKEGHNWYEMDLENYNPEFLIKIIRELLETFTPKKKMCNKCLKGINDVCGEEYVIVNACTQCGGVKYYHIDCYMEMIENGKND